MTDCIRQFKQWMVDKKGGPGFQRVYFLSDDERLLPIEAIADPNAE